MCLAAACRLQSMILGYGAGRWRNASCTVGVPTHLQLFPRATTTLCKASRAPQRHALSTTSPTKEQTCSIRNISTSGYDCELPIPARADTITVPCINESPTLAVGKRTPRPKLKRPALQTICHFGLTGQPDANLCDQTMRGLKHTVERLAGLWYCATPHSFKQTAATTP